VTGPEHLDDEATHPTGWDDDGWEPVEWLACWDDVDPADYGPRRVRDLRPAPGLLDGFDEQRPRSAECTDCPHRGACRDQGWCPRSNRLLPQQTVLKYDPHQQRPADFDDARRPRP
jgi:hypothetical protein